MCGTDGACETTGLPPRVAALRQPWATMRNAFGVKGVVSSQRPRHEYRTIRPRSSRVIRRTRMLVSTGSMLLPHVAPDPLFQLSDAADVGASVYVRARR